LLWIAAGGMIFGVIEAVIPESQRGHSADMASIGTLLGFATMMTLDVALPHDLKPARGSAMTPD
jgi:ZIP family zinc transporter